MITDEAELRRGFRAAKLHKEFVEDFGLVYELYLGTVFLGAIWQAPREVQQESQWSQIISRKIQGTAFQERWGAAVVRWIPESNVTAAAQAMIRSFYQ